MKHPSHGHVVRGNFTLVVRREHDSKDNRHYTWLSPAGPYPNPAKALTAADLSGAADWLLSWAKVLDEEEKAASAGRALGGPPRHAETEDGESKHQPPTSAPESLPGPWEPWYDE